jgi:hypothetical protein
VAVTLIDWDELERWSMINTALKLDRPDPAETYSNSPHFYEELGIPADAVGTIGGARKSSSPRPSRGDTRGDNRGDNRGDTRSETRVSSTDRARRRAVFRRMLEIIEREDPGYMVLNQAATFIAKRRDIRWRPARGWPMDFSAANLGFGG